ncbi:helix-turn-helix domain-containing protein [Streptomyces sp. NPDC091387]|uniref:AraC-like ligand-binding domain-containing protein n=1 Tax=Streptomyces sp. NPDC091387 TaxID=3365998 RepID=UPI0038065917
MGFTAFDTTALSPDARFDWWCETVSRSVAPTRITSEYAAGFAGTTGALVTPAVQITTMSFPGLRSERTQRLIRRSDPETYELVLVLDGAMGVSQSRRDIQLSAGDLTVWSSSRPYSGLATLAPGAATSSAVLMHLPRATLPLPERRMDELLAQRMSSATGVGAVFADFLKSLVRQAATLDERHCEPLGSAALDLATAFLAHHLNDSSRLSPHARHRMLLRRIDRYIEDNLPDPDLSPAPIAAHHQISTRLLHRLFQERRETVSAAIRRRRLARCAADLVDPDLSAVPIHVIGARWGFTDPARFSRTFRAALGHTPSDHRHCKAAAASSEAAPHGRSR